MFICLSFIWFNFLLKIKSNNFHNIFLQIVYLPFLYTILNKVNKDTNIIYIYIYEFVFVIFFLLKIKSNKLIIHNITIYFYRLYIYYFYILF